MVQQVNWGRPGQSLWWQTMNQPGQPNAAQGAGQSYQYVPQQQGLQTAQQAPPEQSMTTGGQPATPAPAGGVWWNQPKLASQQQAPASGWLLQQPSDYPYMQGTQTQQTAPQAGMAYARTAVPDTQGRLPGQPGYGESQPGLAEQQAKEQQQRDAEAKAAAAAAAAANGGGKVKVNADGSWTLPNGTVVPPNARTTINVNGQQVALPFYNGNGMPGRGDFRFNIDGHQEDALTFLARRLTDAQKRGLNITDPNVIYDEIARIRDDMRAAGVQDADLDRASGIGGLQNFVRSGESAAAAGNGAPPGTAPQTGGGGQPPASNVPQTGDPTPDNYLDNPANIGKAASDQTAAYNLYKLWASGGKSSKSGGPFGSFMDSYFGPIAQAAINAAGAGGQLPSDLTQLFSMLKSGMAGGGNLFQNLQSMGQKAMQQVLGSGAGQDYDTIKNSAGMFAPLAQFGLNPIYRGIYGRQLEDAFASMEDRGMLDPTGQMGAGYNDWGTFFQNSPFWQQWYNQHQ